MGNTCWMEKEKGGLNFMNIDLKKKLEGAGRYEEIISILEKLINSNRSSFPVNL